MFSGLFGFGVLSPGAFVVGTEAQDADDRIICNSMTGSLMYDADGNGFAGAVTFAALTPGLALTYQDFMIV